LARARSACSWWARESTRRGEGRPRAKEGAADQTADQTANTPSLLHPLTRTENPCKTKSNIENNSFVQTAHGAAPDKPAGVVAITCLELRRQGRVGRLVLADRSGARMPLVRATLQRNIGDAYAGLDPSSAIETVPADDVADDPEAYLKGMALMRPGDVCIVFTPDDTHFAICAAALRRRLHVLVAKPAVRTLREHRALAALARRGGAGGGVEVEADADLLASVPHPPCVKGGGGGDGPAGDGDGDGAAAAADPSPPPLLIGAEYHKRFDPIYSDARARAARLGPFSYYYSYMAQPKQQLETFQNWAGKSSDISFYLNSHHVDVHCWLVGKRGRPVRVAAAASERAYAAARLGRPCEDTITLTATWENDDDEAGAVVAGAAAAAGGCANGGGANGGGTAGATAAGGKSTGVAVYTASWVAPKGECHTRQHFHYIGRTGELHANQSQRGYSTATDGAAGGYASLNPLYMRRVWENRKRAEVSREPRGARSLDRDAATKRQRIQKLTPVFSPLRTKTHTTHTKTTTTTTNRYTPDARGRFAGQSGYGFQSIARFVDAAAQVNAGSLTVDEARAEGALALLDGDGGAAVTAILQAGRLSLDHGGAGVRIRYDEGGEPVDVELEGA